jgi:Rod binding domain-containing protein
MDSTELMSIQPSSLIPLDGLSAIVLGKKIEKRVDEIDSASEEKKKQIAKDFESILITKLLDEVKNTVEHWGVEQDSASKQMQGIFWLYLAQDIANKGGFGLWKDIYEFINGKQG